ncbi:CMPK1 [Lepeophtheirus salmonis]|uniref:CMPK1 n=1 Tax=Lepeophtheirus salmonis TaxID=72036 RepID=A0A7R8H0F9_LEPSM|nr:CMPK1 [Lepeophtheirus salmonis]CAF2768027.1 CMPK1 [Lepeophtheirus salmonis]
MLRILTPAEVEKVPEQGWTHDDDITLILPTNTNPLTSYKSMRTLPKKSIYDVVFVLGGPGAGKGTQCEKIVEKYGFVHLSAGDLLRAERAKPGSEYGELIEHHIVNGTIVPAAITCALLKNAIVNSTTSKKFLIDGFPRNQGNVEEWKKSDTCVQRCLSRGAAGSGRSDDNIESLKKRCATYLNSTLGVIQSYEKEQRVKRIDATRSVYEVFEDVQKIFSETF